MFILREYQCPSCKIICSGLTPFDVFSSNKDKDSRMDSDGYGWSRIASDNYVMCPECRNVFDIYRGDNGGSTVYKRPAPPPVSLGDKLRSFVGIKKDIEYNMDDSRFRVSLGIEREYHDKWKIITGGFELCEKAFRMEESRVNVRCSVLLSYIWEIERMEESKKAPYLASYNEALSEIIEILENDIAHPEAYMKTSYVISRWDESTGSNEPDHEAEERAVAVDKAVEDATKVLLVAEFYRRKRMFDRAIAILDEHDFVTPYPYQKMAGAIWSRSRNNIPELFYLETDFFKDGPLPFF